MVALALSIALVRADLSPAKLVGIWQVTHEIAAGWNESLCFFGNGKVVWHANQMDPASRLRDRTGTFKVSGNTITEKFTSETYIVGGKYIPGSGGDGDFDIQGGKLTNRRLPHAIVKNVSVGAISTKNGYPSAIFGGRRFWKMKTDPSEYN